MGLLRLGGAVLASAVTVGALAWVWASDADPYRATGEFPLTIVGPSESILFNASVHAENATALSILETASRQWGFEHTVQWYPYFGPDSCSGYYVSSIFGHTAHDASGWLYRVSVPGSAKDPWESPPHSAACEGLGPGEGVEWRWTGGAQA